MIVAAHQPHYLPWIGYFHKMHLADVFVIMDNLEFTKHSYINRNRILSNKEILMLTVPVKYKNASTKPINEIEIEYQTGANWVKKHLVSIQYNYQSGKGFPSFYFLLEKLLSSNFSKLIDLNMELIKIIADYLQIKTKIILGSAHNISGNKQDELILSLLEKTNCDTFITGLGASNEYIHADTILEKGYQMVKQHFTHPFYTQKSTTFTQGISIIDLLLNEPQERCIELLNNCGKYAPMYQQ